MATIENEEAETIKELILGKDNKDSDTEEIIQKI